MFRRLTTTPRVIQGPEIDLRLRERGGPDPGCGAEGSYTFDICPKGRRGYLGYVSLRLGESPELYYLGHVGYRVEEENRGRGYAGKAVRQLVPFMRVLGFKTVVITTDTDNLPSRRTCQRLGCELERVAQVPQRYRPLCMMSMEKCRYILRVDAEEGEKGFADSG